VSSVVPFSFYLEGALIWDEVVRMREGEKRGSVGRENVNPYYEEQKYPEPTVCPRCGLIYQDGRWQLPETTPDARPHESLCPACRREMDRNPAGLVYLTGGYFADHREEILNLARNQEQAARSTRPLQRIMWIEDRDDGVEIATTSSHLATRIAKAVESACKGSLTIKQAPQEPLVRCYWERNG